MTETELRELAEDRRQTQAMLAYYQDVNRLNQQVQDLEALIERKTMERDELLRKIDSAPDKVQELELKIKSIDMKMAMHKSGIMDKADTTARKLQEALAELAELKKQLTPVTGTES